jgi:hypothetical protein
MLKGDFKFHGQPIHHIKIITELCEPVWSPYFSIKENGEVLEFPHGDSHTKELRWYYEMWDEKQNKADPESLICRVHANISDFTESVFNRLTVPWNDLFEKKHLKTLNVVVPAETFICKPNGSTVLYFNSSILVLTKRERIGDAFKEHFLKLLEEYQRTSRMVLLRK